MLPLEVIHMSVVSIAAWNHDDGPRQCCSQGPHQCEWLALPPGAAVMSDPCCSWGQCIGLWSYCALGLCWCLWPESILMSMISVATKDPVWVHGPTATGSPIHGPCWHQKPCGRPGSILPWIVESNYATLTMRLMAEDTQLRKRDTEDFRDNPYLPSTPSKSNSLNRKLLKRTLKKWDRMLKHREDSVLFKGQATESLTTLQWVYR